MYLMPSQEYIENSCAYAFGDRLKNSPANLLFLLKVTLKKGRLGAYWTETRDRGAPSKSENFLSEIIIVSLSTLYL